MLRRKQSPIDIARIIASLTSGTLLAEVAEPGLGRLRDPVGVPQGRVAPAFDIDQHPAHAVLEADDRLPAQPRDDLGDVGEGAVGLARALGDVHDLAAEKLDQTIDRLRLAGTDIEALAADRRSRSGEKR